jgi:hypothetical protein
VFGAPSGLSPASDFGFTEMVAPNAPFVASDLFCQTTGNITQGIVFVDLIVGGSLALRCSISSSGGSGDSGSQQFSVAAGSLLSIRVAETDPADTGQADIMFGWRATG